jgi:hypothetical protein
MPLGNPCELSVLWGIYYIYPAIFGVSDNSSTVKELLKQEIPQFCSIMMKNLYTRIPPYFAPALTNRQL